ncbi:MAG: LysM peptidoglycan-binding domain-containing protein [Proteobacteria bacterium]|nr:LysM peptidoglycan-binding domain-containing protein [Pseudomonadota bacterium]
MNITAYSESDFTGQVGKTLAVYLNPEKYAHNYNIYYNNVQAQGSPGGSPDFNKIGEETMSFELVFDGTGVVPTAIPGVVPFTEDGITEQIDTFKKLVLSYDGNIHSPKYLKLVWGTMLFKCRLTKLNLSFTLFKPDGTPLRARADVSFVGYTDELELAKKANSSSPDLSHLITVQGGDTLPLMCFRVYGSSDYYIEVAGANKLTGFRSLAVGSQLLFPPFAAQTA